jgi:hypothetical protein
MRGHRTVPKGAVIMMQKRSLSAIVVVVIGVGGLVSCGASNVVEETETTQSKLTLDNQPGSTSPYLYDGGSQCKEVYATDIWYSAELNMHCCPRGMAMTGVHLGANLFKCASISGGFAEFALDAWWGPLCPYEPDTVNRNFRGASFSCVMPRNNMHVCPLGWVMIGYNQTNNELLCGRPNGGNATFEYVDAGSSDGIMHVCREDVSNPGRYAMSGIHTGANKFTCAR